MLYNSLIKVLNMPGKKILNEIVGLMMDATSRAVETAIPGVIMVKGEIPSHQLAGLYQPMIGFVVQGIKTMSIGGQNLYLKGPSYFVLPMHIPVTASVRSREGLPYMSVGLLLNHNALQNLLRDLPRNLDTKSSGSFTACRADPEFLEAWLRMLRLLKTPEDISALAPVYEREILYRVLTGPQGWYLRQLGLRESNLSKISQTVQWLRNHYMQPIDIKNIATKVCMAITTFHRQFKQATGLSPIQFQKQLRLLEARNLLAFEGYAVANAAYEVGYQSASQFNREYARLFGASPARDGATLRRIESARSD